MCENAKVSIVIPAYNTEKEIVRCLDSIQKQSYENYEVIIVDDGSTDHTGEVCDFYAIQDARYKVVHKKNGGVSSARNIGIDTAIGEYLMFVDSDDTIQEGALQTYVSILDRERADVVVGGLIWHEGKNEKAKLPPLKGIVNWDTICKKAEIYGYVTGKMYRTKLIKENHIYFSIKMYSQEDLDFNLSVYAYCEKIYSTDYAGYVYNYVSGKRKPPIEDFVANQLKLYRIAKKRNISDVAEKAIQDRICALLFTYFYLQETKKDFYYSVNKIKEITDLKIFLQDHLPTGEKKWIVKWYISGKYQKIFWYFQVRKLIKRILGKPMTK